MQKKIRRHRFLKRRLECLDKMMRQFAYKSDRVDKQNFAVIVEQQTA